MSDKFQDRYRISSARATWWDYRGDAAYFVTICTAGHEDYFGAIQNGIMHLSEMGEIAHLHWQQIPEHFPFIQLDSMVVMPNHVHGILVIDKPVGFDDIVGTLPVETLHVKTLHATSLPGKNEKMAAISPKTGSLSSVIRSYKSVVSKQARLVHADFAWQTRFHDHIIRNEASYQNIREYILTNPARWGKDKYNTNQSTPN